MSPKHFNALSSEQRSLADFAKYLGSVNYCQDSKDEDSTREEAELLMGLSVKTSKWDDYVNHISSSESDSSSSSSLSDSSRRHPFVFVCPSLALDGTERGYLSQGSGSLLLDPGSPNPTIDFKEAPLSCPQVVVPPAKLLGRPLKVDNRDAFRLSTDAMGRNLQQSLQKAIEWRTQTWIGALTRDILRMEEDCKNRGLTDREISSLRRSPQALLYLALSDLSGKLQVKGTVTGFRLLQEHTQATNSDKTPLPSTKRRRLDHTVDLDDLSEFKSTETQSLVLDCIFNLETPAGYAEVSLQVPGKIKGSFSFSGMEIYPEDITSVIIELDTEILAAMLEESSRRVVKACVETHLGHLHWEEDEVQVTLTATTPVYNSSLSPKQQTSETTETSSGTKPLPMVSPQFRQTSSGSEGSELLASKFSPPPIPNDFDPRRISPQPNQTPSVAFHPRTPMRRHRGPSLVSPPASTSHEYREVSSDSPAFPVLSDTEANGTQKTVHSN